MPALNALNLAAAFRLARCALSSIVLPALLSACAAPGFLLPVSVVGEAASCSSWFARLDAVTQEAGVRDGGAHRIAGFPFLRADRFLASFSGEVLKGDHAAFEAWTNRLAELDRSAREVELANLPPQFLASLVDASAGTARQQIAAQTRRCAAEAQRALVAATPDANRSVRSQLAALAQVPDDYSAARRALGLYPLTRIPFFSGVEGWQKDTAAKFAARESAALGGAPRIRYAPAGEPVAPSRLVALQGRLNPDALGIPRLGADDQALLLQAYAPDLVIETRADYDRFGALHWAAESVGGDIPQKAVVASPSVLTGQPVVYQRLAYTRHGGQVLLQLVYSVWFPERPQTAAIDLLGGQLDSVVLRLTLAPDGTPWLYDSIHSCGCYHLFFTGPRAAPKPPPEARMEWAFVPGSLPAMAIGQRVVLQLASQTHYVEGLQPVTADARPAATSGKKPYLLADDNHLRTLPVAGAAPGTTRSAFWPSGIVPGTERGERILFWPMGIASPGAMRQWGRQPTAFVGRRHFDDARLMAQRFELLPP